MSWRSKACINFIVFATVLSLTYVSLRHIRIGKQKAARDRLESKIRQSHNQKRASARAAMETELNVLGSKIGAEKNTLEALEQEWNSSSEDDPGDVKGCVPIPLNNLSKFQIRTLDYKTVGLSKEMISFLRLSESQEKAMDEFMGNVWKAFVKSEKSHMTVSEVASKYSKKKDQKDMIFTIEAFESEGRLLRERLQKGTTQILGSYKGTAFWRVATDKYPGVFLEDRFHKWGAISYRITIRRGIETINLEEMTELGEWEGRRGSALDQRFMSHKRFVNYYHDFFEKASQKRDN